MVHSKRKSQRINIRYNIDQKINSDTDVVSLFISYVFAHEKWQYIYSLSSIIYIITIIYSYLFHYNVLIQSD